MTTKPKTVRQDLGEVISEVFSREWLYAFAEDLKNMQGKTWGEGRCPECGSARKVEVKVQDYQGQLKALIGLLEQAEGRPGTAEGEAGGITLIIERKWPVGGDSDSNEL